MKETRFGLLLIAAILLLPAPARAQSSTTGAIAGTARDATGAVVPGVTAEASSPALIEKVRAAVTDSQGNYKIVDLPPGPYVVTFTLSGFSIFRREGIQLTTGFTANVNADMKLGGIQETVTVTGASPVVDVQNVRSQNVLSHEVLDAVPTNKTTQAFAALTLGASDSTPKNHDVGGNKGEGDDAVSFHGNDGQDSKLLVDGMNINHNMNQSGGSNRGIWINQNAIQETVLETSGISAEAETGGVQVNFVPKDGSNRFSLYFSGNYTNSSLQSNNLTDELKARGVSSAASVRTIYDSGGGIGGPIARDRLWFYSAVRYWGTQEYQPGAFFNKTAGTLFYTPDTDRPAYTTLWARDFTARMTWQVAQKHKVTAFYDVQHWCNCYPVVQALFAPEAMTQWHAIPYILQGTWTFPATSRLLFQAATGMLYSRWNFPLEPGVSTDTIGIFELNPGIFYGSLAGNAGLVAGAGAQSGDKKNISPQVNGRASMSYVTGSNAFKAGMQFLDGWHYQDHTINQSISYIFLNRSPILLTEYATPFIHEEGIRRLSAFVQDQRTVARFTLNLGLRFDSLRAFTKADDLAATRFLPARHVDAIDNVPNFKNIVPRLGVAYDLTGDGRTAIKASIGKYASGIGVGIAQAVNPAVAVVQNASRSWTDNGNYVPDCNLQDPRANGECGALDNQAFGQPLSNTFYAQDALAGWNARAYNWQLDTEVQRAFNDTVAMKVGYYRLWYGNFTVTQNPLVTAASFDPYCIVAPADSRLPGGGGNQICGLYDVQPASFGKVQSLVTQSSNFGEQTQVFNGVDVGVSLRFAKGATVNGGISTGSTVTDSCFLNTRPDVVSATVTASTPRTEGFCHVAQPWSSNTQVKFSGTYPLPMRFVASATLQNLAGIPLAANYPAPSAAIAPSLGRNLSAGANTTVTIPILEPYTKFEKRLNQLDVRVGRDVRIHGVRVQPQFDVYNLFNANTVLVANATYGRAWLQPTAILGARIVKFGAQVVW